MIVAYIDAYKSEFGVEPICRVLRDHAVPIAPSTYYAFKKRSPSARAVSDVRLVQVVKEVHRDNFGVYGARTVWHALRRKGEDVGRDQVARLMRLADVRGVRRRKHDRSTAPALVEVRSPDLVQRRWFRDAPDLVWVCDFTHVRTRAGWMYVSFLQDGFSRRILGFAGSVGKVGTAYDNALTCARRRAAARPVGDTIETPAVGRAFTDFWDAVYGVPRG